MILNICHRALKIYENNLSEKKINHFAGKMMKKFTLSPAKKTISIQAEQGGINGRNKHPKKILRKHWTKTEKTR